MLYIAGIVLAFIFGILIGRGWERSKQDDPNPFGVKLEEEDIIPDVKTETTDQEKSMGNYRIEDVDWSNVAIVYPNKGGRMWN